jgi:pteridine reductase
MKKFAGKRALVTGGAKRLGRAVCLALAEQGADIVIHYHSSEKEADKLAEEIQELGSGAWRIKADLSRPETAGQFFSEVLDTVGPLDYLINSASIYPKGTLDTLTIEDLNTNMSLNAYAPALLVRAFAEQQREGVIINFLDSRIADYARYHVPYNISKRVLFAFTRMMSLEYAPLVRVNGIAPGLILPPPGSGPGNLENLAYTVPLEKTGTIEQITDTVLFLLANEYITGQVIYVDGGRHLKGSVFGL